MLKVQVTHKFSGVEDKKHKYIQDDYELKYLLEKKPFYHKKDTILINTNDKNITYPLLPNGLLNTMMIAYNEHTPLTLRPDDLWTTIVIIFMKYIDRNPDKFDFSLSTEQKLIEVNINEIDFDDMNFWLDFTENLRLKMKDNMKTNIADHIIPTFSTTTTKDRIINNIAFMSGFRKLFSYQGTQCCGLSEITLEGTESDWLNLITKTQTLFGYGDDVLITWSKLLIPVLEEFHNLYMEKVDEDFWQRICTYKTRGSGDDKKFRGWFLVFGPFDVEGKYILNSKENVMKDNIYANDIDDSDIADTYIDANVIIKPLEQNSIDITLCAIIATNYNSVDNMLTVSSDFVAIRHQEITYDIFKDTYLNMMNKYVKNMDDEKIIKYNLIRDFAYFVAVKCNVPNNLFMKLLNTSYQCSSYTSKDNIYNEVYDVLSHKYGQFDKYIKTTEKEIIIAEYMTK